MAVHNNNSPSEEEEERLQKNHWVSDLFPTKFSSEDFFSNGSYREKNSKFQLANDFYSKIYSKVILEEKRCLENKKLKALKKTLKIDSNEKRKANVKGSKDMFKDQEEKKILWTAEELELFKISFDELREHAVWLLCVLENRNLKIMDLKGKLNVANDSNCLLQAKVLGLSKENGQLRASACMHIEINKSLEQQLQFYEEANNILKDKIIQLRKTSNENEQEFKKKSLAIHNNKKETEKIIEKLWKDVKEKISEHSIGYEKRIYHLEKDISELKNELVIKEKECKDCRNSVAILEQHFQETIIPQLKQEFVEITKQSHLEKFINIIEI